MPSESDFGFPAPSGRVCCLRGEFHPGLARLLISAAQEFTHLMTIGHQKPEQVPADTLNALADG
jgi:hypothetical protein